MSGNEIVEMTVNYEYFQENLSQSTKYNQEDMNNSDEKVRLRITSPTLDESDEYSTVNGGAVLLTDSHRINREDSPTDR